MKLTSRYIIRPRPNEAEESIERQIKNAKEWCRGAISARLMLDKVVAGLNTIIYQTDFDLANNEITVTAILNLKDSKYEGSENNLD